MDRVALLREEMRSGLEGVEAVKPSVPLGDAWLRHEINPFDGSSVVRVGPAPDDVSRTLISTAELPGPRPTIQWAIPSPTGQHVAVGLSLDGDEDTTVRVIDVASGEMLPDAVPHLYSLFPVTWLADGSGFYAKCGEVSMADGWRPRTVVHHLGGATVIDEALGGPYTNVTVTPSGDALVVQGFGTSLTPTLIKRADGEEWQPLLEASAGNFFFVDVRDDRLLAGTNISADRGRVVSIPLDSVRDQSTWTEIIPEGDGVMRGLGVLDDHIVTFEIVDGAHRIRVFASDGTYDHTVDLPEPSGLDLNFGFGQGNSEPRMFPEGPTTIAFHIGGFDRPARRARYDVVARELTTLQPVERDDRIVATRHHATAPDGATVGYWHVRLRDTIGPAPAITYAYGGFNVAMHTPCYPAQAMPWLERGGCLILPQLRGGGEQGHAHWQAATVTGKQRTFDDLFAVVEDALARGLAEPGRVGFVGASNGGLTAGAAITQRPELFRAVIPAIPALDLISLPHLGLGQFVTEFGRTEFPEHLGEWERISPLHNLRDGVAYPAVMVDAGEVDTRCRIEPARAFVARLQEIAGPVGHRAILNERPHVGHVSGEGEVWPVWLDFFITELMESDT